MKRKDQLYFAWLVNFVCDTDQKRFYSELLRYLFNCEFVYDNEYDKNLADYGVELRYEYHERIASLSEDTLYRECTLLEMMIALSVSMEEEIMSNDEHGDRTHRWFWGMIESLGLDKYEDSYWDELKVDEIIENFEEKRYQKSGKGGLFTVENGQFNMRNMTIWEQMSGYLTEIINEDGEIY